MSIAPTPADDGPEPTSSGSPDGDPTVRMALAGPPEAGTVLAERYRLVRRLGRGGMGSVWEAEHLSLASAVAVKLIHPSLALGERARARFLREARAAAALRSPHVVQIFDYGVHETVPYIAMERLEGESLAERLRRDGTLSPAEVVRVVEHVARAIGKAHAAGIVHRDLKPDNIFIEQDDDGERCKVLDFGVAKVDTPLEVGDAATHTGNVVGTAYYMSPEQATSADDIDGRSDLWSLAVIAYECLVGARPFDGTSLPAVAVKILAEPPPVPSEHAAVPPGFDAWFARGVEREREQRFGTAKEMSTALAEALGIEGTGTQRRLGPTIERPATEHRTVAPWWRGPAGIVALGAVVMLAAGGVRLLWGSDDSIEASQAEAINASPSDGEHQRPDEPSVATTSGGSLPSVNATRATADADGPSTGGGTDQTTSASDATAQAPPPRPPTERRPNTSKNPAPDITDLEF